jgi:hypothetical protein
MIPHLKGTVSLELRRQAKGSAPKDYYANMAKSLRTGFVTGSAKLWPQLDPPKIYSYASTPPKLKIANRLARSNLTNCSRTKRPC